MMQTTNSISWPTLTLLFIAVGLIVTTQIVDFSEREAAQSAFVPVRINLQKVAHSHMKELVDEELRFIDSMGTAWIAPKGTLTDGATVPRLALWLGEERFTPYLLKAAVIHDAYCSGENANRARDQYRRRPWREVHRMFHEALVADGTPALEAKVLFAAIWISGPRWDDTAHDLSQIPEEVLLAEFTHCKRWIEESNPGVAMIEEWLNQREATLLYEAK
ncbi:MAG: DUF1353 domain-containing protein [Bacteroidota bacterium]